MCLDAWHVYSFYIYLRPIKQIINNEMDDYHADNTNL